MLKILVIGANSYIGRQFYTYLNEKLENKIKVHMISASNEEWKVIDFYQYDSILLLSAIVHRKEKKSMKELYYKVNHIMATEIAKKAKEEGVSQFIFISTAAVFGSHRTCITKDTIPEPTTLYGKSKLAAEEDILDLHSDKFRVAIIRPPMVYGKGCKGNYSLLEKYSKYIIFIPEIHNVRSVISIENLINYLIVIISNQLYGLYHPHDDVYFDIVDIICTLRNTMGKTTYIIKLPKRLTNMVKNNVFLRKVFGDFYYISNEIFKDAKK